MSIIVASSCQPRARKFKTQRRVARSYPPVHRVRVCPLSVGSRRETTRTSTTTMVQLVNLRCVDNDTSSSAAATVQDHRPVPRHGRQLALQLVPVELRTSAALRALASTTVRTSERRCRRRQQRHSDVFSPVPAPLPPQNPPQQSNPLPQPPFRSRPSPPPAPSPTSRQSATTTTTDVDGDVGMPQEPLDQAPTPPPEEDTGDPSLSASTDQEPVADAGEATLPARPPPPPRQRQRPIGPMTLPGKIQRRLPVRK